MSLQSNISVNKVHKYYKSLKDEAEIFLNDDVQKEGILLNS